MTVTGGLVKAQEFGVGVYGNGAELTVSGGVITTVDNAAVAGNGTCNSDTNFGGTTINIEGGTLIGNIQSSGYIANGIYHPQAGVCNISGGTIVANNGVGILMRNGELNVTGNPEVISTGTAKGKVGDSEYQVDSQAVVLHHVYGDTNSETGRTVSIEGGQFISAEGQKAISVSSDGVQIKNFITGGSFSSPVDKEHLDESLKAGLYSPSANPDAPYSYYTSVEEAKAAAKDDPNAVVTDIEGNTEEALYPAAEINGKKYKTLKEAIEHVQSGDTIYVLRNVSDAQGISVPSNNNFTIDFQNHTYTLKGPGAGSSGTETQGFQLLKDSNITMKNGTIRVAENPDNIKMIIQNYANLTLENMQIYAQNKLSAGSAHAEDYVLSLNNGNGSTGSTGSSSTVQQMEEREKPDPADKKAMEEYNFWMQVKSKIRATAEGKTLRITVKEGIEYMPASVMQTLYECKVGITLYWDGVTIEIPVGKAQPKQALRVYWTKTKLMDLYNA